MDTFHIMRSLGVLRCDMPVLARNFRVIEFQDQPKVVVPGKGLRPREAPLRASQGMWKNAISLCKSDPKLGTKLWKVFDLGHSPMTYGHEQSRSTT